MIDTAWDSAATTTVGDHAPDLNGYANPMELVIGLSEYFSVLQWRKTTPVFRQPNTSRSVSVGKRRRRKDSGQV